MSGSVGHSYQPPLAHPIVYAGLIVFGFVWMTGSIEATLRDARTDIIALYGLPFLATLLFFLVMLPSRVRVTDEGIAPSRPLVLRWYRPFTSYDAMVAVYPCYYDVTGAFVSPFASSDGKVTQMGLAFERTDGSIEIVRYTPSRLSLGVQSSTGFADAFAKVRAAFAARDRPLVAAAKDFSESEKARLMAEARKPFLPFFVIVMLLASAAPVLLLLHRGLSVPIPLAIPLALVAPAAVMLKSQAASRRRNGILNALSKAAEAARGEA